MQNADSIIAGCCKFIKNKAVKTETYIPCQALQPYIECFRVVESENGCINRILPGIAAVIALRLKGRVSYMAGQVAELLPFYSISGLRKTPRLIQYEPGALNLLIQFRPAALAAFIKTPVHVLFNESIALDPVFKQDRIAWLEDQLYVNLDIFTCISATEKFLLDHLHATQDELVLKAIVHIQREKGMISIKELADTLYISHDALEKRFRKAAGTSPKQFASLTRLNAVIQQPAAKQDFTDMALRAGFYDQAHFNSAFKQFTGLTPRAYFNAPRLW